MKSMLLMAVGVIVAYVIWFNISRVLKNERNIRQLEEYILYNDGDNDQLKRIKFHSEILEIDSNYSWSLYNRGLDYFELDELDLAVNDLVSYLTLNPESINGHLTLSEVYQYKGNYESAMLHVNSSLRFFNDGNYSKDNPSERLLSDDDFADYYSILLERGEIYYCTEAYDKAIEDISLCIKAEGKPEYWHLFMDQCYYIRAMSFLNLGDTVSYSKDLKQINGGIDQEFYVSCSSNH